MNHYSKLKKYSLLCIVIFIVIASFALYYFNYKTKSNFLLATYFSYTPEEIKSIRALSSNQTITMVALRKWDGIMLDLVKKYKLGDAPASRVYAYLYTAQRDVAFLSMNNKQSFMGSIDLISSKTLCLFFENNCTDLTAQSKDFSDPYSQRLTDIVLKKIKARLITDQQNNLIYEEKIGSQFWIGTKPYFGQDVGSWKPWTIESVQKFVAPPPPEAASKEWQHQLKLTKDALLNITDSQKKKVVFWAGNPGTVTPPGLWLIDANNYLFRDNLPLEKIILVRSVLAMAMADSVIAVFNSKYTYWTKRPFMLDPTILTIMPTPNHPSYPAGHSTISSAAATILIYYFPENKAHWEEKSNEASMGRVWGGIHFMIDTEQGVILGHKVGQAAIAKEKSPIHAP